MKLQGTVALVTGANRGIGAALVRALVDAGAARVYAAMRTPLARPAADVVVPIALDVTDADQVTWAAQACGDVEVLINNAGVLAAQPLVAATDADAAEREMRVNYFGTLRMVRAFAPVLARNGGGAIVNMLSILARTGAPQLGSYAASKAAALSLTQGVRAELAAQGTLVVGVLPALVDTDMARRALAPKLPPAAVAASVVEALRTGTEDIYPGDAATIARDLARDPRAVEQRFAAQFARAAAR